MLRSIEHLDGYKISATDGEIGKVYDFFFDDQSWYVRYLVVELGYWLMGRRVLISPVALGEPDWATNTFPVSLTKEKKVLLAVDWIERINWAGAKIQVDIPLERIKESPEFNSSNPVNRKYEEALHDYYDRSLQVEK